jgi:hypothetical protein
MCFAISRTALVLTLRYCRYKHLATQLALHQVVKHSLLRKTERFSATEELICLLHNLKFINTFAASYLNTQG